MTPIPPDEIRKLRQKYPQANQAKVDSHLHNINRMAAFYSRKLPDVQEPQATMFKRFVAALNYAKATIITHSALTREIEELDEGDRL